MTAIIYVVVDSLLNVLSLCVRGVFGTCLGVQSSH